MTSWSNVCAACRSSWNHWPLACAAPVLQRVAAFASMACAGTSLPPVTEAVATQPVRASCVGPLAACVVAVAWFEAAEVPVAPLAFAR